MNYVELHIGDYDKDTAHLTACEDGIYGRMLRRYYNTEAPLPADVKAVQRLVRARSKEEVRAVTAMLNEFFKLGEDGWHNARADKEIAVYVGKQAGKEGKKEAEAERQRRHRQRRAELFADLRNRDIVPPYDTPTSDLEGMLSRVTSQVRTEPVTPAATANQTPDTRHQTPDTKPKAFLQPSQQSENPQGLDTHRVRARDPSPTAAGEACRAMRDAGLTTTNSSHPELLAMLEAGATTAMFAQAAAIAASKGKGFGYAIGVLRGQLADAAAPAKPGKGNPEARHQQNSHVAAEWLRDQSDEPGPDGEPA